MKRGRSALGLLRRLSGSPRVAVEGIRLLWDMRAVAASGLFDRDWYLRRYPDIASAGVNPLRHYLRRGAVEGRDPNPLFDSDWYVSRNPDVAKAGVNPLSHYVRRGALEGRDPSPRFNGRRYVRQYPDVGRDGMNPLAHYLKRSAIAGRQGSETRSCRSPNDGPRAWPDRTQSEQRPVLTPRPIAYSGRSAGRWRGGATDRRLMCVSHVLPYPSRAGNEYRIHRMLAWLAGRGFEVFVVICPLPGDPISMGRLLDTCSVYPNLIVCQRDGTILHHLAGGDGPIRDLAGVTPRAFGEVLGEDSGAPAAQRLLPIIRTFCPDLLTEVLVHLDAALRPEVVLVDYVFMARALPLIRPEALKVVDTIDVFSTKRDKVIQFRIEDSLELTADEEADLLGNADLVIAIQSDEAEELNRLAPAKPIITAGIDFDPVAAVRAPPRDPGILLVASDNAMNVKGLRDFLRFAWPLIRREVSNAELRVGGAVGTRANVEEEPGVKILGSIDDLPAAYADARVVINPAVAGTGLKVKTVEALCHLRPIVVWPSGVDGLGADVRALCRVATDWYRFSQHVIDLCTSDDAAESLYRARDRIHRTFSADTVYRALGEALSSLSAEST